MNKSSKIDELLLIMQKLRTPETGCPWDLKQNFKSIAAYTIEEAYEVVDAIERDDMDDLKDELGDLLLQVVFHARMAEEAGLFDFHDVAQAVSEKMMRRHPHVFADKTGKSIDDVKNSWEVIKAKEKEAKTGGVPQSLLEDIPSALPGMTRSVKLQKRAARVGFDWPETSHVLDKIHEEVEELHEASEHLTQDKIEEEFGDLLFVMANLARHMKLCPETALRRANAKFTRRFERIEALLSEAGKTPDQSDLAEMDALWDRAKAEERGEA